MPPIEPTPEGVRLLIQAQPRASRTELVGIQGDAFKIRLAAPPVEDAANNELLRFLARTLRIPRAELSVTVGRKSRRKVVLARGVSLATAERQLGSAGADR